MRQLTSGALNPKLTFLNTIQKIKSNPYEECVSSFFVFERVLTNIGEVNTQPKVNIID